MNRKRKNQSGDSTYSKTRVFIWLSLMIVTMAANTSLKRSIVWFRNDLRIHDNPVLSAASQHLAKVGGEHICLYCFDPRHFTNTPYGSMKTGVYRAKFLIESVNNLKKNLREIGSDLVISIGRPEDVLPAFVAPNSEVFVHGEITHEETTVESAVEAALLPLKCKLNRVYGGNSLYHIDDLPYSSSLNDLPDSFTPFRVRVEKNCKIRDLLPSVNFSSLPNSFAHCLEEIVRERLAPSLEELGFDEATIAKATTELDPRGVLPFVGGEDAALQRIQTWMFDQDKLKEYFDIRNGMLGSEYSSKLSPALAHGCVSARKIFSEIIRYERERGISNKSTYWIIFELIWRDFFQLLCKKYGRHIFFSGGCIGKKISWDKDEEKIRRWKEGRTGLPLVDANMRELAATGWMSNRGRQNVASSLVLDSGIDWRVGADHFESLLLDHDVCSNYGNWNAAAGLTGGRVNRFNISKQSRDYDPDGAYIRHWLPELRKVPAPMIFEPWKMSHIDQERYGVKIGGREGCTYPSPVESLIFDIPPSKKDSVNNKSNRDASRNYREFQNPDRVWSASSKRGRVQHF